MSSVAPCSDDSSPSRRNISSDQATVSVATSYSQLPMCASAWASARPAWLRSIARSALLRAVSSAMTAIAPTICPPPSRSGEAEMVTSMGVPSRRRRLASMPANDSPRISRARRSVVSARFSSGTNRNGPPTASAALQPNIASAARLQLRMVPVESKSKIATGEASITPVNRALEAARAAPARLRSATSRRIKLNTADSRASSKAIKAITDRSVHHCACVRRCAWSFQRAIWSALITPTCRRISSMSCSPRPPRTTRWAARNPRLWRRITVIFSSAILSRATRSSAGSRAASAGWPDAMICRRSRCTGMATAASS